MYSFRESVGNKLCIRLVPIRTIREQALLTLAARDSFVSLFSACASRPVQLIERDRHQWMYSLM